MTDKNLKLTDLDYAIADHHMQMLKAAIPFMKIPEQRTCSMFVKWNELVRTMNFFSANDDGMLSICSLDEEHTSPSDMLAAVKPYANQREQDFIDLLLNFLPGYRTTRDESGGFPFEQFMNILPPEQQARFETMQFVMQTLTQL